MKDIEIIEHLKSLDQRKINKALQFLYKNKDYRTAVTAEIYHYRMQTKHYEALFEEAYSDAVIDFYERIDQYNPDLSAIESTIVRFARINFYTAFRTEQRISNRQKIFGNKNARFPEQPDELLNEKERHNIGLEIVRQLGDKCWALINMRYDHLSFKMIAKQLGDRSADAAKQAFYLCNRKFNGLLAKHPDFLETL